MEQSPADRRALDMQRQVSELEYLVADACARGVEASRCREVIEENVRWARRRAAMLPHLDSSLLLSTLEQAKVEIASLFDVTSTNAELMRQELMHHEERAEERAAGGSEDLAFASVQSLPPSSTPSGAGATAGGLPQQGQCHSQSQSQSQGHGQGEEDMSPRSSDEIVSGATLVPAPHTPNIHPSGLSASAADAVAPMRDFASEVAAEAAAEQEEDRSFRHTLTMKASKSGDFRLAKSYDFATAQSPRASYHDRDQRQPFRSSWLSGDRGSEVWDATTASDRKKAGGGEEGQEEEEEEEVLVVYTREAAEGEAGNGQETDEDAGASPPGVDASSPAPTSGTAVNGEHPEAPASPYGPRRRSSFSFRGGENVRCSGIPPGLNPMAAVEGGLVHDDERELIDPHSPTGVGELDLHSYSTAPFTLHSVTPPRHVMDELAAEVQGRLRL